MLCDLECRIAQQNRISFTCASPPLEPYLSVIDTDGSVLVIILIYSIFREITWICLVSYFFDFKTEFFPAKTITKIL